MCCKLSVSLLWCLGASILFLHVHAEVFTAISDVEPLLETHNKIVEDLNYYIAKEEERLKLLKKHLDIYKVEQIKAMQDIPNYLGNPINAFTLIKRLTSDLDHIEDNIKEGGEHIKNITMFHEGVKYPTLEDLTGAALALTRLQDAYRLEVSDLSEGKLNGVIYSQTREAVSTPMSASDCYELGRAVFNEKQYTKALLWMMEARRKFKQENELYPFTEGNILEYISLSHSALGDTRAASEWRQELLAIEPKPHYDKTIAEEDEKWKKKMRDVGEGHGHIEQSSLTEPERLNYEALCRGEIDIPVEVSKSLKCRYLTENHPFLKLAPIKMEQKYMKPDIMMFYDVLSDDESEQIKKIAKPRFLRAQVNDPITRMQIPSKNRISKSSWLRDDESPVVARVSQRVADFTGLSMSSAEELQVVNYGIGGHYSPHFDFVKKYELTFGESEGSNRIATVLFYMTDVAQGGATVFTDLGLSVFPVARAAVFWFNLHPSGEGDFATRHAACPVLRGSKWVCNKWIRQRGQELIKPCDLEYQREGIIRQIPKPVPKTIR